MYWGRVKVAFDLIASLKDQFIKYLGDLQNIDYEDIMKYHMDFQLKIWPKYLKLYDDVKLMLCDSANVGLTSNVLNHIRTQIETNSGVF